MATRRALCLAGGGVLGAAYEIGALAAIEEHFASDSIHQEWDIFVGCSAGAVVASFLVQGVPARSLYDYFLCAEIGPAVLGARERRIHLLESALRGIFRDLGLSNRFGDLEKTLLIPAVDIDDTEREVFGADTAEDVTVTQAIAASCAIPPVFEPFPIGGRRFVDGGFGSPIHPDLAIAAGASHVFALDPIAPLAARPRVRGMVAQCQRIEHAARSAVALAHAQLMAPHVRTLLLRPSRRDMHGHHPMAWGAAPEILRLGRAITARQLRHEDVKDFFEDVLVGVPLFTTGEIASA